MTAETQGRATQPARGSQDALLRQILLGAPGADLHALLSRLRDDAPVYRSELGPIWVLTSYRGVQAALRDPRVQKGDASVADLLVAPGFAPRPVPSVTKSPALVFLNPPDHTRLRGLVSSAFTTSTVEALRPRVQAITADLFDGVVTKRRFDVMDDLAFDLPVRVIGELVGVPPEDRPQFRDLVRQSAVALEPGAGDAAVTAADRAAKRMAAYFGSLVTERRRHPTDDLVSALLAARDGTEQLTRRELIVTLTLIFAAGFETTMNLIGNGVHLLLEHPDQLRRVRRDRSLVPSLVEEILRYESPVQVDGGVVAEPTEIEGVQLPVGEWVLTLIGAANRDPAEFGSDAHRFDVGRRPNQHLAFSSGIHYCLGAGLARLEGEVFFNALLDRFDHLEPSRPPGERPAWRPIIVFRGLERLLIEGTPA